eukprot:326335-Rhodomonas_salina.1
MVTTDVCVRPGVFTSAQLARCSQQKRLRIEMEEMKRHLLASRIQKCTRLTARCAISGPDIACHARKAGSAGGHLGRDPRRGR